MALLHYFDDRQDSLVVDFEHGRIWVYRCNESESFTRGMATREHFRYTELHNMPNPFEQPQEGPQEPKEEPEKKSEHIPEKSEGYYIETNPNKKIFVEVGAAYGIAIIGHQDEGGLKFGGEMSYIGIDTVNFPIDTNDQFREAKARGEDVRYEICFAEHLRFQDETVDEIFYGNVFGDPRTQLTREQFLKEAWRVLKHGGKLTIFEDNTPFDFDIQSGEDSGGELLKVWLSETGFSIEKLVKGGDIEYLELGKKYYGDAPQSHAFSEYILIARKIEKAVEQKTQAS